MGRGGDIAQANVSDPFTLSVHPALGTLRFEPAGPAAVPEPSTCFLLTTGCVGLLVSGWRRRPCVAVRSITPESRHPGLIRWSQRRSLPAQRGDNRELQGYPQSARAG